jgi:hypothetical protein
MPKPGCLPAADTSLLGNKRPAQRRGSELTPQKRAKGAGSEGSPTGDSDSGESDYESANEGMESGEGEALDSPRPPAPADQKASSRGMEPRHWTLGRWGWLGYTVVCTQNGCRLHLVDKHRWSLSLSTACTYITIPCYRSIGFRHRGMARFTLAVNRISVAPFVLGRAGLTRACSSSLPQWLGRPGSRLLLAEATLPPNEQPHRPMGSQQQRARA